MRLLNSWLSFLFLCVHLTACANNSQQADGISMVNSVSTDTDTLEAVEAAVLEEQTETTKPVVKSGMELQLEKMGLVDVNTLDATIVVEMIYATPDNFTGEVLYDSLRIAYLLPHVAEMLVKAQHALKAKHPDYNLVVYDAARPVSVQRKMWNIVRGTPQNIYVSNPNNPGLHNYGAAVDLSVLDNDGNALDMGTPFDFFGSEAHIDKEEALIKTGKLTREQVNNRKLLREVMQVAGFKPLRSEWWHFNACTRDYARKTYKVIDF